MWSLERLPTSSRTTTTRTLISEHFSEPRAGDCHYADPHRVSPRQSRARQAQRGQQTRRESPANDARIVCCSVLPEFCAVRPARLKHPVIHRNNSLCLLTSCLARCIIAGKVRLDEQTRAIFRQLARMGGKARAAKLSPEERSAIARKASRAAAKARSKKAAERRATNTISRPKR